MKAALTWILRCPICFSDLDLQIQDSQKIPAAGCPAVTLRGAACANCEEQMIDVRTGSLVCKRCRQKYEIIGGIPRFGAISEYSLRSAQTKITPQAKQLIESIMPHYHYYPPAFIFDLAAYLYDTFVHEGEIYHYMRNTDGTVKKEWLQGCLDSQLDREMMFTRYDCLFPLQKGAVAFDIACGNAIGIVSLARKGFTGVGVDADLRSLKLGQARATHDKVYVDFVQADVESLPFKDACMDVGMSVETIEHVTRKESCLLEMWRLLKPRGLFYVNTPNVYFPLEAHDTGLLFIHWLPYAIGTRLARQLRRGNMVFNEKTRQVDWGLNRYISLHKILRILGQPVIVNEFFPKSNPIWWKNTLIKLINVLSSVTRQPKTSFVGCIGIVVKKPN